MSHCNVPIEQIGTWKTEQNGKLFVVVPALSEQPTFNSHVEFPGFPRVPQGSPEFPRVPQGEQNLICMVRPT